MSFSARNDLIPGMLLKVGTGHAAGFQTAAAPYETSYSGPGPTMRPGDYVIFLGWNRARRWVGEEGMRFCKLLVGDTIGWYDDRAMDIFVIVA